MIEQNVSFLSFGFRFGRIHPPGVGANAEQAFVYLIPVILSCLRVGGVVDGHSNGVVRRLRILELVHKPALLLHVVVVQRSGLEEGPYGNHQMEICVVQLIDHALRVGIILVEDELSLAIPPEPVLHDVVHRNMQVAVLPGYAEDFLLPRGKVGMVVARLLGQEIIILAVDEEHDVGVLLD